MRIQLCIEANDLDNVAGFLRGTSDPYCVVKLTEDDTEIERTETIKNNLSPKWAKPIYLQVTDLVQPGWLSFTIKDDNRNKTRPREDVFMGRKLLNISRIIEAIESGERIQMDLDSGNGDICIYAQESQPTNQHIKLQLRGLNIKNIENGVTGLGKTDPFIQISKKYLNANTGNTRYQVVYRSEPKIDHLNPVWEVFEVNLETFCDDDVEKVLEISLWDWEKSGQHRWLGSVETTVSGLIESVSEGGNADRSKALRFVQANFISTAEVVGYLVVLQAEFMEFNGFIDEE